MVLCSADAGPGEPRYLLRAPPHSSCVRRSCYAVVPLHSCYAMMSLRRWKTMWCSELRRDGVCTELRYARCETC
eukprot:3911911-Rhodomonas_salina.1